MGLELREIQSPIFSEPLDFTFHEQAFTLLVGSSGSGKSSLFQMIAQVSSLPYSGQVTIQALFLFENRTLPSNTPLILLKLKNGAKEG